MKRTQLTKLIALTLIAAFVISSTSIEAASNDSKYSLFLDDTLAVSVNDVIKLEFNAKVKSIKSNKKIVKIKKTGKKSYKITAQKAGTVKITYKTIVNKELIKDILILKISKQSIDKESENYKIINKLKKINSHSIIIKGYENIGVEIRVMDKKVSKKYFDDDYHSRYDFKTNTVYIEKGYDKFYENEDKNEDNNSIQIEDIIAYSIQEASSDWGDNPYTTKKYLTQLEFVKNYIITTKKTKDKDGYWTTYNSKFKIYYRNKPDDECDEQSFSNSFPVESYKGGSCWELIL